MTNKPKQKKTNIAVDAEVALNLRFSSVPTKVDANDRNGHNQL